MKEEDKMHNVMYLPLQYHKNSFPTPKFPLYFIYSSLSLLPKPPAVTSLYTVFIFLSFFRMSNSWNNTIVSLFRLASFT